MTGRRRGAQPGNKNALKHGFYSRSFRNLESEELDRLSNGLADEITLLRVLIRRVFEAANDEEDTLDTWVKSLHALSMAASRIAALVRTQKSLNGDTDTQMAEALSAALQQISRERDFDNKFGKAD